MRGATQCARRLKQVLRALRRLRGGVQRPPSGDPITQLILGIFSRDVPESRAREALNRLRAHVVDYNELRVIPPIELTEMVGDMVEVRSKCEDLSRALNAIFLIEHKVSLDRLVTMPRKDAQVYLDKIEGLDGYTRARVRLLGLHQHAIPLDTAMWAYARHKQIVDPRCPLEEAQRFLERQIPETDAVEFFTLFRKQAWAEMGAAVRRNEVERVTSIPPKREVRNMLAQVAAGETITAPTRPASASRKAVGSDGQATAQPAQRTSSSKRAASSRRSKRRTTARTRRTASSRKTTRARKTTRSASKTKGKSARARSA